jgi:hypothetical protein
MGNMEGAKAWEAYKPAHTQMEGRVDSMPFDKLRIKMAHQAVRLMSENKTILQMLKLNSTFIALQEEADYGNEDRCTVLAKEYAPTFKSLDLETREAAALIASMAYADSIKAHDSRKNDALESAEL